MLEPPPSVAHPIFIAARFPSQNNFIA